MTAPVFLPSSACVISALTPANLALVDLEVASPSLQPLQHGRERRFLCPFCGAWKKSDASHRSLTANTETGLWCCHRCGSQGLLREFRTASAPGQAASAGARLSGAARQRNILRRTLALPSPLPPVTAEAWDRTLVLGTRRFEAFDFREDGYRDARALSYLSGRGISSELAYAAQVRFCPSWFGRPAITFPLLDGTGGLAAAQGRYVDGRDDPKTRSAGEIGRGVFATPGAWAAPQVVLTEAPLDALSLAVCGLPALALCGKDVRSWLLPKLAFRHVLVALDADGAGDAAAVAWVGELRRFGASAVRLRPEGGKDWNEVLTTQGRQFLADQIVLADQLSRVDQIATATTSISDSISELSLPEALPSEALPSEALPSEALPSEALPSEALPSAESLSFFDQVCQIFGPVTILDL